MYPVLAPEVANQARITVVQPTEGRICGERPGAQYYETQSVGVGRRLAAERRDVQQAGDSTSMNETQSATEPSDVYPEERFEATLTQLVRLHLDQAGVRYTLVPKFGLDIAVFFADSSGPTVRFIEAKSYGAQRAGGVGFGNGKGIGPQVEVLLCAEDRLPDFEPHIRWALVDATKPVGTPRYAFFSCSCAKGAAMGGVSRAKQNNFKVSALESEFVSWLAFSVAVRKFLLER